VNWEVLGALAEVLGGMAVVTSLVFVGYQLRQQSWDWATNVLLVFESVLYMKAGGSFTRARTCGSNSCCQQFRVREAVASGEGTCTTSSGPTWLSTSTRIKELGDTAPPWNELMPHFKRAPVTG